MSYRLTEAERKHFAAVEDTKFYFTSNPVEGQTPDLHLHFTDGDKLEHDVTLPSYKFSVTKDDDRYARIVLKDVVNGEEIQCQGYDNNGVGWRYDIAFVKDGDSDYIKSIKLIRKNDGKFRELTFSKLASLTIRDLTVDQTFEAKCDAKFDKNVNVTGTFTAESDANIKNLTVEDAQVDDLHVSKSATFEGKDDELAQVNFKNTVVSIDDSNDVDIAAAKIHSLQTDGAADFTDAKIGNLEVTNKATVQSMEVVGESNFKSEASFVSIDAGNAKIVDAAIDRAKENSTTILESFNTLPESKTTFDGTVEANNDVKLNGKTTIVDTDIIKENVSESTITNATIIKEKVIDSDVENQHVAEEVADHIIVKNGIDSTLGNLIKGTGDDPTDPDSGKVIVGNGTERMVIKSAGYGDVNDDNHFHIEAEIDGRKTFLMTAEDAKELGLDNVVDRTSNQTVNGIKQFNNALYANDVIKAKTYQGEDRNIIYRGLDPNDPNASGKYIENEDYKAAQEEAKKYNAAAADWSDAYVAAQKANAAYEQNLKDYAALKTAADDYYTQQATQELKDLFAEKLNALQNADSTGVGEAYTAFVDALQSAIDSYNATYGKDDPVELKRSDDNFTNDEGYVTDVKTVADETLDKVDAIYAEAQEKLGINNKAQAYIDDINSIFTKRNIQDFLFHIPGQYSDIYRVFASKDFNTAYEFFDFITSLDESDQAERQAKNFAEQWVRSLLKNPRAEDLPIWSEENAHIPGMYNDGTNGHYVLVARVLPGSNEDSAYVVKRFLYEVPTNLTNDKIAVYKDITLQDILSIKSLKNNIANAKNDLYNVPAQTKGMKEASDVVRDAASKITVADKKLYVTADDVQAIYAKLAAQLDENEKKLPEFLNKSVGKAVNALITGVRGLLSSTEDGSYGETTLLKNNSDIETLKAANAAYEVAVPNKSTVSDAANAYGKSLADQASAAATFNELSAKYAANEYMQKQNGTKAYTHKDIQPGNFINIAAITPVATNHEVELYKSGNIVEKYVDPKAHTVMVLGNTKDEMQFESAALPDGDEHLVARVAGHLHQIAYLEDLDELHSNIAALNGVPVSFKVDVDKKTGKVTVYTDKELKTVYTEEEKQSGKHGITEVDSNKPVFELEAGTGIKITQDGHTIKISADEDPFDIEQGGISEGSGFIDENGNFHEVVIGDSTIGYYDNTTEPPTFHPVTEDGVSDINGGFYGPDGEIHPAVIGPDGHSVGWTDPEGNFHDSSEKGTHDAGGVYDQEGKYHSVTVIYVDGEPVIGYYDRDNNWHTTTEPGVKGAGEFIDSNGHYHDAVINPENGAVGWYGDGGEFHYAYEGTTTIGGFIDTRDGSYHPASHGENGQLGWKDYTDQFHPYDEVGTQPAGGFIDKGGNYYPAEISEDGNDFGFHDKNGKWHSSTEDGVKYVLLPGGFYGPDGEYHPAAVGPQTVGWRDDDGNFHPTGDGTALPIGGFYDKDTGEYYLADRNANGELGYRDPIGNFHSADEGIPAPTGIGGVAGVITEDGKYHPAVIGYGEGSEEGYYDKKGDWHSADESGVKIGGGYYDPKGKFHPSAVSPDGTMVGYYENGQFVPASTEGVTPAGGYFYGGQFRAAEVKDGKPGFYADGTFHPASDADYVAGGYYGPDGKYYQAAINDDGQSGYYVQSGGVTVWHPADEPGTIPVGITGFFGDDGNGGTKFYPTEVRNGEVGYTGPNSEWITNAVGPISGFYGPDGDYHEMRYDIPGTTVGWWEGDVFHPWNETNESGERTSNAAPNGPGGVSYIIDLDGNAHPAVVSDDGNKIGYIDPKGDFRPADEGGNTLISTTAPGTYVGSDGNTYPAANKAVNVIGYIDPETGIFHAKDDGDKEVKSVSGAYHDPNNDDKLFPAAIGPNGSTVGFYSPDENGEYKFHPSNEHGVRPSDGVTGFTDPNNGQFYPATTNETGTVGYITPDNKFHPGDSSNMTNTGNTGNGGSSSGSGSGAGGSGSGGSGVNGGDGTNGSNEITFGNRNNQFSFISSHDDLKYSLTNDKKIDINFRHIYTGDLYKKNDIIRKYNDLTQVPAHNKEMAKALDVAVIRDELTTICKNTQSSLDTRLPSAPRSTGSYILNAITVAGEPDENGEVEMTTKYSWNGSISLPDTGPDARDDLGKPLVVTEDPDDPVEYGLKLRIIKRKKWYVDGSYKEERVPILTWSRMI